MTIHSVVLGMDIGGTTTALGLVDRQGHIYKRDTIPTLSHEPAEKFFKRVFERCNDWLKDGGKEGGKEGDRLENPERQDQYDLKGIGIGAPNANYYRGTVEYPPNLDWGLVQVLELVKTYYPLPSAITNDANAAALGEMMFGAAKGMNHFIQITLGTGLGSGIVVNGDVIHGHDGFAGEIGHISMDPEGRICGCGNPGCLETYASATGIIRTVFELLARATESNAFREIPYNELTSKIIFQEAQKGNEIALQAFEITGDILGRGLAISAAHLNPGAIVLSGGLAQAGDFIFKPTHESLEKRLFPVLKNKIKLIPTALPEGDAAILGSAALIWKELDQVL